MSGNLCLSFDNLGEAAELELGALDPAAVGEPHPTVTTALPAILEALAARELAATFFVEGLNAELYPEALREIAAEGHEVGLHAWRHEQWGALSPEAQEAILSRGIDALSGLGLAPIGMRPPGGDLGPGGLEALRKAGLRYCSPAGCGPAVKRGIAFLPFQWRHVDASCVLPGLGPQREPAEFQAFVEAELRGLALNRGWLTIVLHPFMLDWLGRDRFDKLLDLVAALRGAGELRVERFLESAERLLNAP